MHCHAHSCKHESVKFCKECKKVYCADCKQEWEDPCNLFHYSPWTYTYYAYPQTATITTGDTGSFTTTTCSSH